MKEEKNCLINISHASRRFGDVVALDDVSLDIRTNEFFAILGPSGCGKTTLLRVLAGFETLDSGEVTLDGQDLTILPPNKRPINLMFQSYALFPHMNVEANVAFGLEQENLSRSEIRERVNDVLEKVSLIDKRKMRPTQLSGGQRQRVALARAIVKRPKLILLDEPLSSLDKKIRGEMQIELKRLQHEAGITFVVVTHDQEEAMSLADRIAVMSNGKVVQLDSPRMLYENPKNLTVATFIGESNIFDGIGNEDGLQTTEYGLLPGITPSELYGKRAVLVVRPEEIRIVPHGAISGEIIDVQYLGGVLSIAVQIAGRSTSLLISSSSKIVHNRGERISLEWSADSAIVLGGSY